MQSDAHLLEEIGKRNESAFDTLYDRYHDSVLRLAGRIVKVSEVAEDVAQEVFLRVWRKSGQWDGRGSVKGWLLKIATNVSLNHLEALRRRSHRRINFPTWEEGDDLLSRVADTMNLGPEESFDRNERLRHIEESLSELSEEKREVLKILLSDDVTLRDISARLDLPLGTVKSRVHYASRDLRELLNG